MILPTVRASFGRAHARHLVHLVAGGDAELLDAAMERLDRDGLDALLDDPRTRNALLTDPRAAAPPELIVYVLVRQALLEGGVDDRSLADYVASLVLRFGEGRRAFQSHEGSGEEHHYLADIVIRMQRVGPHDRFLLGTHLGNFSLWLAGLFPRFIEEREERRGAPPITYYECLGAGGFHQAAHSEEAAGLGLDTVLRAAAGHFRGVRIALNRISDRVLWPTGGSPVGRLVREMEQFGPGSAG